ncbi:hypothetical protein CPB83DRAFT_900539 [Crepidotus variabilis]|uniref:Uncharacterized protein n=1 Tax=Crepidotus variabilis TaxID=179855 RepID=A0A9P6E319_9AGAR|nr:hypothetical protein CPB83DRAFT_900539 [Crepidotus variabilis]
MKVFERDESNFKLYQCWWDVLRHAKGGALWGFMGHTPSFCALIEKASRATRDFSTEDAALPDDDVIEHVLTCGKSIITPGDLWRNCRWNLAFGNDDNIAEHGQMLLDKLSEVYANYDDLDSSEDERPPVASPPAIRPD